MDKHYIQVKTGIQFASVISVNGREKVICMDGQDAPRTTYIDAQRAKALAFALLEAAKRAERVHG